jgi:hypothetical protein
MSKINENIILHGGTYTQMLKQSEKVADHPGDQVDSVEAYGNNNLRDLTLQFHESGKSPAQIYSILMGMGVPKDKATFACEQYIPKNKIAKMATSPIQEKLDLKGKLEKLHEEIGNFKTRNQNYVTDVKNICEKYIKDCDKHSPSTFTRAMISELNNYNWMSPVADCISSVEAAMTDNAISVQVNEAFTTLYNNPQSKFYANAITDLGNLRNKSEEELRAEFAYGMNEHIWIPQVKAIVESVESLNGKMTSTSDGIITKKYSPILETKDGLAVHISGKV